jgi:glutamate transport system permease protein
MSSTLYDTPGPVTRRRTLYGSIAGGALILIVLGVAAARLASKGAFDGELWQVLTVPAIQRLLLRGLLATLEAAGIAMLLAMLLGALLAVGALSRRAWLRRPVSLWVEFFRGVPLLLLILFGYLGLPQAGLDISTYWALVTGLTLYNSAIISEIFRAGILSLPRGQSEAAEAIGLRRAQVLRIVLIPQAIRLMLPALISQGVTLLKDTSLGFVISYSELLRNGRGVVEYLGGRFSIPVYTAIAVVYIGTCAGLSWVARWTDRRMSARYGKTVTAPSEVTAGAAPD